MTLFDAVKKELIYGSSVVNSILWYFCLHCRDEVKNIKCVSEENPSDAVVSVVAEMIAEKARANRGDAVWFVVVDTPMQVCPDTLTVSPYKGDQ